MKLNRNRPPKVAAPEPPGEPETLPDDKHANPPGVACIEAHPFELVEVVRLWHREGSERGRAEVVVETKMGEILKGAWKPLKGFYEPSVKRPGKRLKILTK